jgi:hypothetical protein
MLAPHALGVVRTAGAGGAGGTISVRGVVAGAGGAVVAGAAGADFTGAVP